MFRSSRERLVWALLTAALAVEIRFDVLGVVNSVYKTNFQRDSDILVQGTLQDSSRGLLDPMLHPSGDDYTSQFGLQGIVMAALSPDDRWYGAFRCLTALLAAAVLASLVVACWRAFGARAAGVLTAFLALCTWMNLFGLSTYWQLWTLLLPSVVPLLVWPHLGTGRRKWVRGLLLIAGLMLLRSLCGYEFVSTMVLSSVAAVAFHEFRGRIDRRLVLRLGLVGVAAVAGFFGAVVLHVLQLVLMYGDASVIVDRLSERTFSPGGAASALEQARAAQDGLPRSWLVAGDSALGLWLYHMIGYLTSSAITFPGIPFVGLGGIPYGVPVWVFALVCAVLAAQAWRGRQPDALMQRRLALSAGIGFLGAMSWYVLAYGHMIHHPHIDSILFSLPFLPFVFGMIALRVDTLARRVWPPEPAAAERPVPGVAPGIPVHRRAAEAGPRGGAATRSDEPVAMASVSGR